MRYPTLVLTLLFLVSLTSGSAATFQNPQETPAKPLYKPSGKEVTLTGSIIVNGEIPKARLYDMSADPVCVDLNRGRNETDFLLIKNQRLQNAFIYVKDSESLKSYRFEITETEVMLDRKNCRFLPLALGMRAGQRLSIVNSDPTVHNTHPTPKLNPEWNYSLAPGSSPLSKTFSRPEQFIPVKCNQHPWEKAYVGVFDHPFFAVSDAFGNFEIRGLPPGTYKLAAWHKELGEQESEITVAGGENRKIDFTFDSPAKTGSRMN